MLVVMDECWELTWVQKVWKLDRQLVWRLVDLLEQRKDEPKGDRWDEQWDGMLGEKKGDLLDGMLGEKKGDLLDGQLAKKWDLNLDLASN
jgi:hypothetical protein